MAAPTTAAPVKKALANPEPSTHRPRLPTWTLQQGGGYLGYTGHQNQCSRHEWPMRSSRVDLPPASQMLGPSKCCSPIRRDLCAVVLAKKGCASAPKPQPVHLQAKQR